MILIELAKKPSFTMKERGRCFKVPDFTDNFASTFSLHSIFVVSDAHLETIEKLMLCDKRLNKLEKSKNLSSANTFESKSIIIK